MYHDNNVKNFCHTALPAKVNLIFSHSSLFCMQYLTTYFLISLNQGVLYSESFQYQRLDLKNPHILVSLTMISQLWLSLTLQKNNISLFLGLSKSIFFKVSLNCVSMNLILVNFYLFCKLALIILSV